MRAGIWPFGGVTRLRSVSINHVGRIDGLLGDSLQCFNYFPGLSSKIHLKGTPVEWILRQDYIVIESVIFVVASSLTGYDTGGVLNSYSAFNTCRRSLTLLASLATYTAYALVIGSRSTKLVNINLEVEPANFYALNEDEFTSDIHELYLEGCSRCC